MKPFVSSFAIAASLLLGAGLPAVHARPAPPPSPIGIYGLRPGIFVAEGTDCGSPPNAAIKQYDGKGIATAHTHACEARVLSRRNTADGIVYDVSQTCIDGGEGPGKPFTEKHMVRVRDPEHVAITSDDATVYHYCPIGTLPPDLRSAVRKTMP
ncbi:hypothetical protein P3W24_13250 [Luteibacter sp. PPL201]|uniref:Uncharacterized protein n=1 Tax=Luteibacter sahnii TaxID=3021977 RepID=A0ABT6BCX3_9GAMM|nr:hypothetical protein [Luteibacter sp. PPL193]MDY1549361.1 hypothetical protein [Luteibacter sp. PPL193]